MFNVVKVIIGVLEIISSCSFVKFALSPIHKPKGILLLKHLAFSIYSLLLSESVSSIVLFEFTILSGRTILEAAFSNKINHGVIVESLKFVSFWKNKL